MNEKTTKTLARAILRYLNGDAKEYLDLAMKVSGDCTVCGGKMIKARKCNKSYTYRIYLCTNCGKELEDGLEKRKTKPMGGRKRI